MNTQSSPNAELAVRPQPDPERPGYFIAGTGAPIVMLHASLGSKSQWNALAERMARRFRVIALDLCGYGDNARVAGGTWFTVDDEVRLVRSYLDDLVEPNTRIHVVGHSYGGLVALRMAQCMSERVASLSLYEPVAFRVLDAEDAALGEIKRSADRIARLIAEGRRHEAAQAFVDFWTGEGNFASIPLPAQGSIARRIDKVLLDFQATWRWPLGPADLRAIVAPTLLLAGHRSPEVVQRIVTSLTRMLPDRRVGWFDCGHMGPITDPHRINPWIEAFVDICAARQAVPAVTRALVTPAAWPAVADCNDLHA